MLVALWEDLLARSDLPPRAAGVTSGEYELATMMAAESIPVVAEPAEWIWVWSDLHLGDQAALKASRAAPGAFEGGAGASEPPPPATATINASSALRIRGGFYASRVPFTSPSSTQVDHLQLHPASKPARVTTGHGQRRRSAEPLRAARREDPPPGQGVRL